MEDGRLISGRYELTALLARGGMAEVYRAQARGLHGFAKPVVIKRILPDLASNPRFVEMFVNEAKIAVSLSHANIVQVFDLGQDDDTYFIAMEYVPGLDLGQVLERVRRAGTRLPWQLAAYVGAEVAKALDYAHRRRDEDLRPLGIVHRDVSPQNVLLGWEGEVKLTDFGVAKARLAAQEVTDLGLVKGKYAYMAPEQASGARVDGRGDLFSLGTILYEAFAGKNPFLGKSAYETLQRVRRASPPPLALAAPHVPRELAELVERALRPEPGHRPASAGRFYEGWARRLHLLSVEVGPPDLATFLAALRGQPAPEIAAEPPEPAPDVGVKTPVEVPVRRAAPPPLTEEPPAAVPGDGRPTDPGTLEGRAEQALVAGDPKPGLVAAERLLRRTAGEPSAEARSAVLLARLLGEERRFDEALDLVRGARRKAARADRADLACEAWLTGLELELARGDLHQADEALASRPHDEAFVEPDLALREALALARRHALAGAADAFDRSLARCEAVPDAAGSDGRARLLDRWDVEFVLRLETGAIGAAASVAERAMELAWDLDRRRDALRHALRLGELCLRAGDDRRAFGYLKTGYDLAREEGFVALQHASLRALACLDAVRFGAHEGLERVERARAHALSHGDVEQSLAASLTFGHTLCSLERAGEARVVFDDARRLATRAGRFRVERIAKEAVEAVELGELPRLDW